MTRWSFCAASCPAEATLQLVRPLGADAPEWAALAGLHVFREGEIVLPPEVLVGLLKQSLHGRSGSQGAVPGGTQRNFASYGHLMGEMPEEWRNLLCDPQTSGGLLLAVTPESEAEVQATAAEFGITLTAIGELVTARGGRPMIEIR